VSRPKSEGKDRRVEPRRSTDALLVDQQHFLSAILNTESVLILLLDLSGKILRFNRACELLTGFSFAEAEGRYFWQITNAEEEAESVQDFFRTLLTRDFPESHERAWRAADGSNRLLRWSVSRVPDQGGADLLVAVGHDITEMNEAEEKLRQRSAQLTERVKELRCLYGITLLGEKQGLSLEEFLQGVVELIPGAWQFPEYASAEISFEDFSCRTGKFAESSVCQQCSIALEDHQVGAVRVCYSTDFPGDPSAPFLEEEERLLKNIGEAIRRVAFNYRSRDRISEYQARLRSLASEMALTGQRERRRIAQQLHDDIGHNLALLKFKLGEQRGKLAGDDWEQLAELLETSIQASRTLTFELSPPVLHELGLVAALEWLCHQLEANYGIACRFVDDQQLKPLGEDLRVEVFQAVRELLTNVGKHSQATEACVSVLTDGAELVVEVSDNGVGFDIEKRRRQKQRPGWGLFSIRERLAHLGGQFQMESTPGQGTNMALRVPLASEDKVQRAPSQLDRPVAASVQGNRRIKILLADDQQLTCAGLKSLLEREHDMAVVGEAGTGAQAVELAAQLKPDVIVMDVAMPEMNGIEATRRIIAADPEIKVIGLSMHSDGQYVLEMLRAGATGYLLKDCAQEDLAQAIRIVQANLTFLSPGLADSVARDFVGPRGSAAAANAEGAEQVPELTPRERQVLVLMAEGLTTKQIANELEVSVKTVESHRQHIMEKLGDNSIAGLTRYAIQRGLIDLN